MTTPVDEPSADEPAPKESPARGTNFVSAQLLLDLVANTLDPGYAAAAKERERSPRTRRPWYDGPLVAAGAVLVGFLLVIAYVHTNRGAPEAKRVHERLVERVDAARDNADRLAGDLSRDQGELDRQQAAALPSSGPLAQAVSRAQLAAGEVAVTGPGLRVKLSDPPAASPAATDAAGRGGSVPIAATHILTDRDVRAVVNELWLDGAEAIAVNDVRLTPTSAIRFAGEAVLVDFRPLTSPYTIRAIGDADRLATEFAQSAAASKYQTLKGVSGIGFDFGNESHLELPANSGVTIRYAAPVASPTATPTPTPTPSKTKKRHDR